MSIQRAIRFRFDDAPDVECVPRDEERLTREEVTSTVHYLEFPFTPEQADALRRGPARIVVGHPEYSAEAELSDEQRAELVSDLS